MFKNGTVTLLAWILYCVLDSDVFCISFNGSVVGGSDLFVSQEDRTTSVSHERVEQLNF